MTDQYYVVGNPIAHSKSPDIHQRFADQTGQSLVYDKALVPIDAFNQHIQDMVAAGAKGFNVTVPFKEEAFKLADELSRRAQTAGAANTLIVQNQQLVADNTDGIGLVNDLTKNHGVPLADKKVLVLGAGGAVRGVLEPLLVCGPKELVVANRTKQRAERLGEIFPSLLAKGFDELDTHDRFDVIINGTSASLAGDLPAIPTELFKAGPVIYDMMYGAEETVFNQWALVHGAKLTIDGLGMLVEQAAESFRLWRGVQQETQEVIGWLRGQLKTS